MSVALAQAGAKVVGVARRSCEDTKKLIEADGGEFAEVIADLSDMSAIDVIVNGALAAFGKVDILVNNAGLIKRNDAIDFTEDEWDSVIQVNQKMVFFLSQAFAKQYIKQGHGGKIININSMLSYQGGIQQVRVLVWDLQKLCVMSGHAITLMLMLLHQDIWLLIIRHS